MGLVYAPLNQACTLFKVFALYLCSSKFHCLKSSTLFYTSEIIINLKNEHSGNKDVPLKKSYNELFLFVCDS